MEDFEKYFAPINSSKAEVCESEELKREMEAYNEYMTDVQRDYQSRAKVSCEKSKAFCFSC